MKKLLFLITVLCLSITGNSQEVRNYVNLYNSANIINPPLKYGWGSNPVFYDEFTDFNNTKVLTGAPSDTSKNYEVYKNDFIHINPTNATTGQGGWRWFWATHNTLLFGICATLSMSKCNPDPITLSIYNAMKINFNNLTI